MLVVDQLRRRLVPCLHALRALVCTIQQTRLFLTYFAYMQPLTAPVFAPLLVDLDRFSLCYCCGLDLLLQSSLVVMFLVLF